MHQNTFLTTPEVKKIIFFKDLILVVWKYAQMFKNTFSNTSDVKKVFFKDFSVGLEMHKNTFLTTPDVKK